MTFDSYEDKLMLHVKYCQPGRYRTHMVSKMIRRSSRKFEAYRAASVLQEETSKGFRKAEDLITFVIRFLCNVRLLYVPLNVETCSFLQGTAYRSQ